MTQEKKNLSVKQSNNALSFMRRKYKIEENITLLFVCEHYGLRKQSKNTNLVFGVFGSIACTMIKE